jgi:hypothetical protein
VKTGLESEAEAEALLEPLPIAIVLELFLVTTCKLSISPFPVQTPSIFTDPKVKAKKVKVSP